MIPKIIHYCWFGGNPLPEDAVRYIESWKIYCPDYEIKEWNESNFDFSDCQYAQEAYQAKKWAFVSDYARFKILYEHGGLYFDTDVEVIKSLDDIVEKGSFMGLEKGTSSDPKMRFSSNPGLGLAVAPGLGLAAAPGLVFYKTMVDKYKALHFINTDGSYNTKTVVDYTTEELVKLGLKDVEGVQRVGEIYIYPSDYFCPMDYITGEIHITENSRSIHHYSMSWYSDLEKYAHLLKMKWEGKLPRKLAGHIAAFVATVKFEGFGSAVKKAVSKM